MPGFGQDVIICLGDSLTQRASRPGGFVQLLSQAYVRKLDVLNRGYGGYNSLWTLAVLKQCLPKRSEVTPASPKIHLLTVWLGANDSVLEWKKQHVPIPAFKKALTEIVHTVTSPSSEYYSPETKVILLSPPPINTIQRAADLASRGQPLDRSFDHTARYAEVVRQVSAEENVPFVDVYERLWELCGQDEKRLEQYMVDGLHVNDEAYGIIYEDLIQAIRTHYPELDPEYLQPVFPTWDQLDQHNPNPQSRAII
ncbi:SGNH hydrolase-type esterase domain-containing protein [Cytidiella melzeri]|nr:SGNH hydrolase-type esterase domain-containing protein [Cytidiella melzeri]